MSRIFRRALSFLLSLRATVGSPVRQVGALVAVSVVAGLAEAALLILIVKAAAALAAGESRLGLRLPGAGGLTLDLASGLSIALALTLAVLSTQVLAALLTARMSASAITLLRKTAFRAFIEASWAVQAKERSGALQESLTTHVSQVANAVHFSATGLVALVNLLILLTAAFLVDAVAALVILALLSVLFVALLPLTRRARSAAGAQASTNLDYASAIAETVRMALEYRVFNVGQSVRRGVDSVADDVERHFFRTKWLGLLGPTVFRNSAFLLLIFGLASLYVLSASNVSTLGAALLLIIRALAHSQILQRVFHWLNELQPYLKRVNDQRDMYLAARIRDGGRPLTEVTELRFSDVGFEYEADLPVLEGASFVIDRGDAVGVIGPSGSGKSTALQILMRLRAPTTGAYSVNRRPAADYSLDDWWRLCAAVPQTARLLSGTVRENIAFFRADLTSRDIEEAARLAQIQDEIASWPSGYDTRVGERGLAVSGGQAQRICLARALAGKPEILFLDEPASALDSHSEHRLNEVLRGLMGRVTLVVIAHRVATLRFCNRILVLRNGSVEAFGSPDEVAAVNPYYRETLKLSRQVMDD